MNGEDKKTTFIFTLPTVVLVTLLVGAMQVSFWIATEFSEIRGDIRHLMDGEVKATADRWTKRDDDSRHAVVMVKLDEIDQLVKRTHRIVEQYILPKDNERGD